jgi:hypothetical protein
MEIEPIIAEWETRVKQVMLFTTPETLSFGNVSRAIDRIRSLAQFLQYNEPILREWMMTYLAENRTMIFARWNTEHVNRWVLTHTERYYHYKILYPNAKTDWNRVFGNTDICFETAEQVALDTEKKRSLAFCDEPAIIKMHEAKEHTYDDWEGCWYCEDQERAWQLCLEKRMKQIAHPLVNGDWRSITHRPELATITDWEPPHKWDYECPTNYHDLATYKAYICKQRAALYVTSGETMYQAMKKFVPMIFCYGGWLLSSSSKKTDYDRFIQLWNTLDLVLFSIRMDIPTLVDMEIE